MSKFTKNLPFEARIYFKNSQRQITLAVIGNKKFQGLTVRRHHGRRSSSLIPKIVLCFLPFRGRVENQKCYRSLRLFNIFKSVLQIMIEVFGLHKKKRHRWLPRTLVFDFQVENMLHGKVETSNISGTLPTIVFIIALCVWENNMLLNKNYLHDLDS